jgi:hypothetical protein
MFLILRDYKFPSNDCLVRWPDMDIWVKADSLGAKLRQLEQLSMDVEIGCRSSVMCELLLQRKLLLPLWQ